MTINFEEAVQRMARDRGAVVSFSEGRLHATIRGRSVELAVPVSQADVDALADVPSALPSRAARGDIREKTLYNVVQDMAELTSGKRPRDGVLRDGLESVVRADPASRRVLASVMAEEYWFTPGGRTPARFLMPFHADLPAAYDYKGRYKSFRGSLLLFICFDGEGFDLALARELLSALEDEDGLNPLDREFLRAARAVAENEGQVRFVSADRLLWLDQNQRKGDPRISQRLEKGALDQAALDRIRCDLRTVLRLPLPRHDKVSAVVLALSLHVALHYYRVAFTLGQGLDEAARALDGQALVPPPSFDGQILFRVGSGGDRPVAGTDPCARAWWSLDEEHLLALPANMISANLLHQVSQAVAGASAPALPAPYDAASAVCADLDSAAAAELLCACAASAVLHASGLSPESYDPGSGGYALKDAPIRVLRGRGSALKQRGRDVVHTLVGGFSGNLKRSRGRVRFFELDEEVLTLLVTVILHGSGRPQMALRSEFLPELARYGLSPQDAAEVDILAGALERLGLLERYSDAGEATYVRSEL